jgi:hypothetical protein
MSLSPDRVVLASPKHFKDVFYELERGCVGSIIVDARRTNIEVILNGTRSSDDRNVTGKQTNALTFRVPSGKHRLWRAITGAALGD